MSAELPTALDLLSIGTAGLFGTALAVQRKLPLVAVALVGILSALGGGMLRDLLLGAPLVAMRDQWYLPVAAGAALLGLPLARRIIEHPWIGLVLDGLVLGLFTLVGTEKALIFDLPVAACVFIGLTTSIGGGTIVDLLVGKHPTIMERGPWFATAALVGAIIVVAGFPYLPENVLAALCVLVVAVLRVASVRLGWQAPSVVTLQRLRRKG